MASANIANDEQKVGIRELNDAFRKTGIGGRVTITKGVFDLGQDMVSEITKAVQSFDDFNPDNDPYGEHDCASVMVGGHKVFWKIDYYDIQLECLSPDASNPDLTSRVMTIMLSHEY